MTSPFFGNKILLMAIDAITKPNTKGQVVIPKEMRDKLGITPKTSLHVTLGEDGIHMYPVDGIIEKRAVEGSYLKILEKTQGSWTEDWSTIRKKRGNIEKVASRRRKRAW